MLNLPKIDPTTADKIAGTNISRYGNKRDVAAMLGLSVRSIDNLLRRGMPHVKLTERVLRFDLVEVHQWIIDTFRQQRLGSVKGKV